MLNQNKFLTTLNQPLSVALYSMVDPSNNPVLLSTLEGVPLGTSNNAQDGEIGAKVIIIADRSGTLASLQSLMPAETAAAVTPDDSTPLTSRGVWIGGAGDLAVRLSGDPSTTVTFSAVTAGTLIPMSVVRVMAATTATNIVVLN